MKLLLLWALLAVTLASPPELGAGGQCVGPVVASAAQEPFANEIAAFEKADLKSPPAEGGVVFIGSSSFRLWTTVAQDFPDLPVINRGFGGSQIADSMRYADRIVIPYKPRMVVMYAGGNDLNAGKTPDEVLKDFAAFVDKVHTELPAARIVYVSINPSVARWSQETQVVETNRMVQRWIRQHGSRTRKLSFIDSHSRLLSADKTARPEILRPDGLHLNTRGYILWNAILNPQIMALWKADTKQRH